MESKGRVKAYHARRGLIQLNHALVYLLLVFEDDAAPAHFVASAERHDLHVALIGFRERLDSMVIHRRLSFKHLVLLCCLGRTSGSRGPDTRLAPSHERAGHSRIIIAIYIV